MPAAVYHGTGLDYVYDIDKSTYSRELVKNVIAKYNATEINYINKSNIAPSEHGFSILIIAHGEAIATGNHKLTGSASPSRDVKRQDLATQLVSCLNSDGTCRVYLCVCWSAPAAHAYNDDRIEWVHGSFHETMDNADCLEFLANHLD
ncbi:hypothetical protein HK104_009177 [Borealophlyctis nickersoniae]|nr:hypothetical protein HK104_009177 [Borealophlyctis nickersoniae]